MVECPKCGNPHCGGNFCGECGYKLRRKYMVCPSCYHISVYDEYCIKCGTKLKSDWEVSSNLRKILRNRQYRLKEQIEIYDKIIEINPNNSWYRAFKSYLLLDLGKFDEAIECLDEGLSITPKDTYLLVKKADIYKNCAQKDKAMEYLDEALEFDSTNLDALESKINLLKSIGKEDEIQIYLKKILEITPNEYNIHSIARSLENIGEYNEAIKYYEKEKDMDSDFNSAFYIPSCFIKIHKFDEAIKCINSEMESAPYNNSLKIIKANIYSEMGEYDKAIDIYDNILDDEFKSRVLMEKANILIKMKRDDEAKTCLLSIQHEDNLYLWERLAGLYKEIKDYQNALNCCEKALSIFPQYKSILLLKAELYFELGQYNDSVIACADLYMLNPYYDGLNELREKIRKVQSD